MWYPTMASNMFHLHNTVKAVLCISSRKTGLECTKRVSDG